MALPPPPLNERNRLAAARQAAVQRADQPPSSAVLDRKLARVGAQDPRYLTQYQLWQDWIRRYARTQGVVRFAGSIVADCAARVRLLVEQRDENGEWQEDDSDRFVGIFENYCNPRQESSDLIRRHAWHYEVAGEMAQVIRDGPMGLEWAIYSMAAIEFKKTSALVKDVPNGNLRDGTAFEVPRTQIQRFWLPDEEWLGLATSPMAASINDLHRYASLVRYAQRGADSALAMNGMLWTPNEAHERSTPLLDEPGAGQTAAGSKLEQDYLAYAQRSFEDDDTIASVAPMLVHWGSGGEAKPPEYVKIGDVLDPNGTAYRREALEDFARGVNLPQSLVVGGAGGSEGNHWSEWLVDERYFKITLAPLLDKITHLDLTLTYLAPYLRLEGEKDMRRYRVGYDPQDIIVKPDQSESAIRLHLAGLLSDEATLEAANFSGHDLMGPVELEKLIKVLSAKSATPPGETPPAGPGGPPPSAQPATQIKGPPPLPALPPAATGSVTNIFTGSDFANARMAVTTETAVANERVMAANRALSRIAEIRRTTARQLLSAADVAVSDAIARGGGKVKTRATARKKSAAVKAAVAEAVEQRKPLRPLLAAVGIKEAELVQGSFAAYSTAALLWLQRQRQQVRQALANEGFDVSLYPEGLDAIAAGNGATYLADALTHLVLEGLVEGNPLQPDRGEVSGLVPPSFVRDAISIGEGRSDMIPGATPESMPEVVPLHDVPDIENVLASDLQSSGDLGEGDTPEMMWVHGFYGDPHTDFEPHADLGAVSFTTTDTTSDPALINTGSWPDGEFFQPGDHDYCTCEWVPTLNPRYAQEPARSDLGTEGGIPGLGPTPRLTQLALDAANRTPER